MAATEFSVGKICRAWVTLPNGRKLFARDLGLQAICFTPSPRYFEKKRNKEGAVIDASLQN